MTYDIETKVQAGTITSNFSEIKNNIIAEVKKYETMVFTEDQIQDAKDIRAKMNKLSDALNDERKRQEKIYMQPFTDFKNEVNDLVKTIKGFNENIDSQIKGFEEKYRTEKKDSLKKAYGEDNIIPFEKVFDERYLNKTISTKQALTDMVEKVQKIKDGLNVLNALVTDPSALETMQAKYLQCGDINQVVQEYNLEQEMKKRAWKLLQDKEQSQPQPAIEEDLTKYTLVFQVNATKSKLSALSTFLKANGIDYKRIK